MNISELYDKIAESFRLDIGMIAPGKDIPPSHGGYTIEQEGMRMQLWNVYVKGFNRGMTAMRPESATNQ